MFSDNTSFFSNPFAQNNNQAINFKNIQNAFIKIMKDIEDFFKQFDIHYFNNQLKDIFEILFRTNNIDTHDYGVLLALFILGPGLGVLISTLGGIVSLMSYIFQLKSNGQYAAKDHLETCGNFFILSFICALGSIVAPLCLIAKLGSSFLNEPETQNRHTNSYRA